MAHCLTGCGEHVSCSELPFPPGRPPLIRTPQPIPDSRSVHPQGSTPCAIDLRSSAPHPDVLCLVCEVCLANGIQTEHTRPPIQFNSAALSCRRRCFEREGRGFSRGPCRGATLVFPELRCAIHTLPEAALWPQNLTCACEADKAISSPYGDPADQSVRFSPS